MKCTTLSFLIALGFAAPAFAAGQGGARPDATSGYGMTSGAPAGMQSEAGAPPAGQTYLDMPQPQTVGDVTYLCGGIGETEASYMKQQARNYDMLLTFAAAGGAYLANVDVDISGPQGSMGQIACDGPILLVDVPRSGTYRVVANAGGFEQSRSVRVQAGRSQAARNVHMTWPRNQVAQMQPETPAATGGQRIEGTGGAGIAPTN